MFLPLWNRRYEHFYIKGEKDGVFKKWSRSGGLTLIEHYNNGKLVSSENLNAE